jgi:hypothetical protein
VVNPHRQARTVPITKVQEWLVWLDERSQNSEHRRLSNRLSDFCRSAGASGTILVGRDISSATSAEEADGSPGVDLTKGEIAFTPYPGFGPKTIDRLITRVVAVTGIPE